MSATHSLPPLCQACEQGDHDECHATLDVTVREPCSCHCLDPDPFDLRECDEDLDLIRREEQNS